jgi:hypothetical protein
MALMPNTPTSILLSVLAFGLFPLHPVKAADSISAQDLAALSQADRVAVMKTFVERRIQKVQNIDIKSETRTYFRKYANGKPGGQIGEGGWFEYDTQRFDGSYRVKSRFFPKPGDKVPNSTSISHYDQKTGIVRIMAQTSGEKETQGRIGLDHLTSMHSNRVAFHLLAGSYVINPACDKCEFLLESLASCSNSWSVEVNQKSQQAIITHPHYIAFCPGTGTGTRRVYFDIAKGMLPVRIVIDWRGEFKNSGSGGSTVLWREERIFMDQPRNFDGFWMTTRIEERIRTERQPDECSIFSTRVKQVVFGQVKEGDLHFTFPPDTTVADALKNVWYRTGPDGEPTGPINPIGIPKDLPITLDEEGRLMEKPGWMLRYGVWFLGIGVGLMGALVVVRRHLRAA